MSRGRLLVAAALVAASSLFAGSAADAQAVTTGSVSGVVTTETGEAVANAQVQVLNRNTGFTAGVTTGASGRYTIAGLEVGGNYALTVRRIGFEPQTRDISISLGSASRADFVLSAQTVVLAGVTVTGVRSAIISPTRTGSVTAITDTALRRLPTLNRNFTDFVALTPQVSTTLFNGGLSGGGTNNRYNNVQIDGTSEADVFGLGSTGQPGGQANGKSIGLESVKEYVVMLSPYDVRQGFFAGLLINAVTKSGTNELHGSAFGVTRSEGLTRSQDYITEYDQKQFGFSVGGPIVRNRAFFFFSPEWQTRTSPADGPYLGQPGTNLTKATTDEFLAALGQYSGLNTNGTFGLVNLENPLTNVFTRFDFNLPWNSQLILRYNYGSAQDDNFFRSNSSFRFSDNAYFFHSKKHAPAMQLRTLFPNGSYNELLAGYTQIRDRRTPVSPTPQVTVETPGFRLISGAERFSHGNELDQDIFEITNNFTMPFGSHRITLGTQNQFQKFRNLFAQANRGVWNFDSLDDLRSGTAQSYIVGVPLEPDGSGGVRAGGDGAVRFKSAIYSLYAQDEWSVTPRINVTIGLRADIPVFKDKPPTNPAIQTSYGFNTADVPSGNLQWSPRVGFNWDVTGDAANQLRGGVGLFTGRPAYVWLSNMFQNSGMGAVALLTCNATSGTRTPPAFNNASIASPPSACGGGQTAALGGEINVIDPDLKYPQNMRATLGYDRRLFGNWVTTLEAMYTKGVNGLFYENFALAGPQGTNPEGRVVYGTAPFSPTFKPGGRSQVFAVSNQSEDYAYSFTAGIQRRYFNNFEGSLFYTNTHAYDVQSFTSSTSFSQLRFGRVWGGNVLDKTPTRSTFEQRNRIIATAMYTLRTKTDIGLTYFGESGAPYSYIASGDLNADGLSLNDPVYVPNDATNPTEMVFLTSTFGGTSYTPAQQAEALESFINSTPCLNENRGSILPRNACTGPWTNSVNLKLRQSFRTFRLQHVTVELDIFNFLNLLNKEWGLQESPGTSPITLLTSGSYTGGDAVTGRPTYRFNPGYTKFFSNNLRSNYQMQLQAKYTF
ncbi:MAG TPA: carboxypeptidase regulatory-like domain-containing protein [Gemmatimonadaceae bacterium]|nr:carboxypeptidase regulatory-like domain-containing protein [Gemmatimonadaceae bacterium]